MQWMVDHACKHGLVFKTSHIKTLYPEPAGKLHDSCQGIWVPLGTKARPISKTELVHLSVKKRMDTLADYRPENLPEGVEFLA